ncbi:hypothetical protein V8C37DRAFT_385798 [Trichoderma ceciliae]
MFVQSVVSVGSRYRIHVSSVMLGAPCSILYSVLYPVQKYTLFLTYMCIAIHVVIIGSLLAGGHHQDG